MRVLVLLLVAVVGLSLPEPAAAQSRESREKVRRVEARRAASVWQTARDRRGGFDRDRDSDSDSDSDSDWDSDSDSDSDSDRYYERGRRGSDRYPAERCDDLERELDRAHDGWHRRNDRYEGDRRYRQEHDRLHERMDEARQRAGCRRSTGSVLEDIIFGRRDDDRRDRRDRRGDGGILDRLPGRAGSRDLPGQVREVRIDQVGSVLDRIFGGG